MTTTRGDNANTGTGTGRTQGRMFEGNNGRPVSSKMLTAIDAYKNTDRPINDICKECGVSSGGLGKHIKRLGLNRVSYSKRSIPSHWRGKTGDQHPVWKGTHPINHYGYIIGYHPEHPWPRGKTGQIAEHIRIMELHIGRRLQRGECVHHKDGDRQNNALENLKLTTIAEHSRHHRLLEAAQTPTSYLEVPPTN